MTIESILNEIRTICEETLGGKLTGVYVHGSIAFGCFRWETSDVDFLVAVREVLMPDEKVALMDRLLQLDALCPPKGMEMSVVLEKYCRQFVHPAPYELHFSHAHLARAQADVAAYCRDMHGVDRDLAAHFTVVRKVGVRLCGEKIDTLFGEVPHEAYMDSLMYDIENAEAEIVDNPVYMILNLCRVLAYVREGAVLSKAQGGAWAAEQPFMPIPYRALILKAREVYCEGGQLQVLEEVLTKFASNFLMMIKRLGGRQ